MTRIAVLGANGQVGAEVCLLLHRVPGVELVPVCRSRQGSAYLRYRGIACRHGSVNDPARAESLLGDCDVIVNLVLMTTTLNPAGARRAMAQLIDAVARAGAKAQARHVFLSTMSVYGDREVGARLALRNAYGADKRRAEHLALRAGRRYGCPTTIFRLGHVCGELQGITQQIRDQLRRGTVAIPDPERASNTTQVAAIADAVLRIAAGAVAPGTYDLMNTPQWTWREVYAFEARVLGHSPSFLRVGDDLRPGIRALIPRALGVLLAGVRDNLLLRRAASRVLPWLPAPLYRRLRVWHARRSAATEIRAMQRSPIVLDATRRTPIVVRTAAGLTPTATLLESPPWTTAPAGPSWPAELPAAGAHSDAALSLENPCRA